MSPRNAPQGTTFKTFCLLWFLAGSGAFHIQPNARFSVVRRDSGVLGSSRRGTLTTRKATEKSDHGGRSLFFAAHTPSTKSRHGFLGGLFSAGLLTIGTFSLQPVWARPEGVNKPELLPKERSNVIDLERFLTSGQKKRLSQQLDALEKDSGIKVRLLCQRYPDTPGLAIKDYWGLDDKSIVVVADKGPANIKQVATRNLLNFNVGSGLQLLLPPAFWNRLRSQFGSIFYLRSHGDDEAIIATINTIDTCIRLKGCVDVPKGAAEEEGVFSFLK